ncbi:MAG TPA: adenylate/guanylate cyclase domain-containing protein [Candidatus Methylomirabilis sp.]|nr:adenylate/guanylate cyclase domain-containing protein [Candidatus Methylomirabilis sp.]
MNERQATAQRWRARLRLWSGCVLFTYVTLHLANHALGLVSLDAMDEGRVWFIALWRNPLGTIVLYTAFLVHLLNALWSIYRRRTLRMPPWEATQLLVGLAIPSLLIAHVVGTRLAYEWYGQDDPYHRIALAFWELRPWVGLRQSVVLILAWLHGSIGLHFWLRLRSWYPRVVPLLFAIVVLLPTLALLGFAQGGREAAALARLPGGTARLLQQSPRLGAAERDSLDRVERGMYETFAGALALALVARAARRFFVGRWRAIRITYQDGPEVRVPIGFSILEASRFGRIPHASVCGGRGRCSTCRVQILRGIGTIPTPSVDERRVLDRVGAPPGVRLACQSRPTGDVAVRLLLPAAARASDGFARPRSVAGAEQDVTILFADLRKFTTLAEHRLPYDVVFFLNRYFETVGRAIEGAGGITNQFTGDGVMALFGVDADQGEGCRRALMGARAMVEGVSRLSRAMVDDLDEPLRIGIGIHTGPAVVGRMGYGGTMYLTAVGDTVHVASRLQDLTKEYHAQLVISDQVAARAGLDVTTLPRHEITVRNRHEPLAIRVIADVEALPTVKRELV